MKRLSKEELGDKISRLAKVIEEDIDDFLEQEGKSTMCAHDYVIIPVQALAALQMRVTKAAMAAVHEMMREPTVQMKGIVDYITNKEG